MIAPAVSICAESSMLKSLKNVITDYNKKIIQEKCRKYHLNISESPINKIKKEFGHNIDEEMYDAAGELGANDVYYERSIDNAFKKKLRKRSIRSLQLLNFSN
jgi:hypothetical protein